MPALRGTLPTRSAQLTFLKPSLRSAVAHDVGEQREGAVVEFHDDALEGGEGGRDFDEVERDGLVGAEDGAGGDAEQEGVADLAGGAGDGDSNGLFHGEEIQH